MLIVSLLSSIFWNICSMHCIVLKLWLTKLLTTTPVGWCCWEREVLIFGIIESNLLILYSAEERFFLLSSNELPILLTNGTMRSCVMSFIQGAVLDGCVGAGGRVVCTCWLVPACSPCCSCSLCRRTFVLSDIVDVSNLHRHLWHVAYFLYKI